MITGILAMAVIFSLFYGQIDLQLLILLCLAAGIVLARLSHHKHTQFLSIDIYAQVSRMNQMNPMLKFVAILLLMVLCIVSETPVVGMFLVIAMMILVVFVGKMRLHDYVHLLGLPVSFLLISGLALLFEVHTQATGVFHVSIFGVWLCVSRAAQVEAALVIARAFGAVSCLYLLSLTTPMAELIGVLRRLHCPRTIIDLMYLIYRYIFILLTMYHTMKNAAKSRLGYVNYRTNMRTTGNIYSNLVSRSYRMAAQNFDAMESRCYRNEIHFLEQEKPVLAVHMAIMVGITAITLVLML